jgi:hypothetical protein
MKVFFILIPVLAASSGEKSAPNNPTEAQNFTGLGRN